jgi:hypothetical protein
MKAVEEIDDGQIFFRGGANVPCVMTQMTHPDTAARI